MPRSIPSALGVIPIMTTREESEMMLEFWTADAPMEIMNTATMIVK